MPQIPRFTDLFLGGRNYIRKRKRISVLPFKSSSLRHNHLFIRRGLELKYREYIHYRRDHLHFLI